MSLKNEGIDEYIATLTFPIPDRRLLKVNSIEGIDSYFDEQIKNRKARLDKYKKLLTLQSSLWVSHLYIYIYVLYIINEKKIKKKI